VLVLKLVVLSTWHLSCKSISFLDCARISDFFIKAEKIEMFQKKKFASVLVECTDLSCPLIKLLYANFLFRCLLWSTSCKWIVAFTCRRMATLATTHCGKSMKMMNMPVTHHRNPLILLQCTLTITTRGWCGLCCWQKTVRLVENMFCTVWRFLTFVAFNPVLFSRYFVALSDSCVFNVWTATAVILRPVP